MALTIYSFNYPKKRETFYLKFSELAAFLETKINDLLFSNLNLIEKIKELPGFHEYININENNTVTLKTNDRNIEKIIPLYIHNTDVQYNIIEDINSIK